MLALTFQVGPDRVAVDVRRVREVVPRVRLTPAVGRPTMERKSTLPCDSASHARQRGSSSVPSAL